MLTCAHAISADGDPTEDELDSGAKQLVRLGRHKTLISPSGEMCVAVCTAVDEAADVAALKIVWSNQTGAAPTLAFAPLAPAAPAVSEGNAVVCIGQSVPLNQHGCPVIEPMWHPPTLKWNRLVAPCIDTHCAPKGNPYDWNHDRPSGAVPNRMGCVYSLLDLLSFCVTLLARRVCTSINVHLFVHILTFCVHQYTSINRHLPFTASLGRIEGYTDDLDSARGLGGTKHSCWTYWGHSGAPLFDARGTMVGMHNAWDADNYGQRHAVSWCHLVPVLQAAVERGKTPLY